MLVIMDKDAHVFISVDYMTHWYNESSSHTGKGQFLSMSKMVREAWAAVVAEELLGS